jgi:AraC-like DNA-binding protein
MAKLDGQPGPEPSPPAHPVDVIRDYLQVHLADRVTLAELARATGLTDYAVLRGFRRATGIPPHRYLTQLRVRRAGELLRAGHSPVMVARAVGFADQSHLNRHFRRLVGVTPGTFTRRQERPEFTGQALRHKDAGQQDDRGDSLVPTHAPRQVR